MLGYYLQMSCYQLHNANPKIAPIPFAAFQPPETNEYRFPDTIDTFQTYKFRDTCDISSLDLHASFSPLCQTRDEMLSAMSGGGRIGHDAPYMPRGCDMRWFTTDEVCEILARFDRVVLVGDSMLRHVVGSINILLRKDIGYGAVTDWNFSPQERYVILLKLKVYADTYEGRIASAMSSSTRRLAPFKAFTTQLTYFKTIQEASNAPTK